MSQCLFYSPKNGGLQAPRPPVGSIQRLQFCLHKLHQESPAEPAAELRVEDEEAQKTWRLGAPTLQCASPQSSELVIIVSPVPPSPLLLSPSRLSWCQRWRCCPYFNFQFELFALLYPWLRSLAWKLFSLLRYSSPFLLWSWSACRGIKHALFQAVHLCPVQWSLPAGVPPHSPQTRFPPTLDQDPDVLRSVRLLWAYFRSHPLV